MQKCFETFTKYLNFTLYQSSETWVWTIWQHGVSPERAVTKGDNLIPPLFSLLRFKTYQFLAPRYAPSPIMWEVIFRKSRHLDLPKLGVSKSPFLLKVYILMNGMKLNLLYRIAWRLLKKMKLWPNPVHKSCNRHETQVTVIMMNMLVEQSVGWVSKSFDLRGEFSLSPNNGFVHFIGYINAAWHLYKQIPK